MIIRLLLCCLAAVPLSAQLTFCVIADSTEVPLSSQAQLATTATGDTLDTLFRVRNTGKSNAPVTSITIGGTGFSVANLPALPATLTPGGYLDFTVRFQPAIAAAYSAVLKTDGVSVFVLGTAVPVAKVYVEENGSRRQLDTGAGLDFGAVERGAQASRRLLLINEAGQPLSCAPSIVGSTFRLAPGTPAVVALDPLNAAYVDVTYAPVTAGAQQGELRIDTRRFPLRGTTVEPPLPRPIVTLDFNGAAPASGGQPVATVRFDPPPRTSGTGTLRLEFHPSVAATEDPAIMFLTNTARSIGFSVIEGVPDAQFGPVAAISLQTGTTAGTIVLTAELGNDTETASVEIPPQPVAIDAVQMTRTASGIDLRITGYDNTRTLAGASFTFLQKDGTVFAPGIMQQDLTAVFKDYFASSSMGGSFELKLSFPVTGGTATIDSVRVVLTNAVGQTTWP